MSPIKADDPFLLLQPGNDIRQNAFVDARTAGLCLERIEAGGERGICQRWFWNGECPEGEDEGEMATYRESIHDLRLRWWSGLTTDHCH